MKLLISIVSISLIFISFPDVSEARGKRGEARKAARGAKKEMRKEARSTRKEGRASAKEI